MTETPALPVPAPKLTVVQMATLAREIAMNIRELSAILADFKLTESQYQEYAEVPFFKNALEAATIEWNSALSTHQRIKVEAAAALEDALPVLAARMTKDGETLPAAVETGKLLAKLAGIGEQARDLNPGEKFSITINLGDDKTLKFEKDVTPTPPAIIDQKETDNEPA